MNITTSVEAVILGQIAPDGRRKNVDANLVKEVAKANREAARAEKFPFVSQAAF
jgi:hypothetical protein